MAPAQPSKPLVQHLVFNVRDIERSDAFYRLLGFEQCAKLDNPDSPADVDMRFYRGDPSRHHDLALVQLADPEAAGPVPQWDMFAQRPGINHVAMAYGSRQEWLDQLEYLQANGVEFLVRGNHGMTHSAYIADPDGHGIEILYDLPAAVWEGDVDAAMSHFEVLPTEGPESLQDDIDYKVFGRA